MSGTGDQQPAPSRGGWGRALVWGPGLAVALGAAAATAHGLYEVALAALVPAGIAWLYPLITDGLALVAYTATARLTGRAARYAWAVVIVAAGLSGLAQAAYLATGAATATGAVVSVPAGLRFGVGAWPAVAAAVVAHLLYLLAHDTPPDTAVQPGPAVQPRVSVQPSPYDPTGVQPSAPAGAVHPGATPDPAAGAAGPVRPVASPRRDRAQAAARRHARRHGAWPTVTEIEAAAQVSRGTAAAALKTLRDTPLPAPHLLAEPTRDQPADGPPHAGTAAAQPSPNQPTLDGEAHQR